MAIKGNIPDIGKAYIMKVGKDLEAEVAARKAGDSALGKRIDDLTGRVGTVEGKVESLDNRVTYIENNYGGSTAIDATLTKEGEAADAKAVGDRLGELENGLREAQNSANDALQRANMALDENDAQDEEIDGLKKRVNALESGSGGGEGGSVSVDDTLTKAGEAADAKAVGDRLRDIDDAINSITDNKTQILLTETVTWPNPGRKGNAGSNAMYWNYLRWDYSALQEVGWNVDNLRNIVSIVVLNLHTEDNKLWYLNPSFVRYSDSYYYMYFVMDANEDFPSQSEVQNASATELTLVRIKNA